MAFQFEVWDVFTETRFAGNPLAIVLAADGLSDDAMQKVAREFNLSETIFVQRPQDPANSARVRIFLPTAEIPFAGHPTLGCALLLASQEQPADTDFSTEIRLEEEAGLVPVQVERRGGHLEGLFRAPVVPFRVDCALPDGADVSAALGLPEAAIGIQGHTIAAFQGGPAFLFVPIRAATDLAAIRVDSAGMARLSDITGLDSVYAYAPRGDGEGYRGRMFAPAAGIPEDPATGSATAVLAAQLLHAGALQDGLNVMAIEQGYEMGRPSQLRLEADVRNGAIAAVRVGGSAVPVSQGQISIGQA